MTTPTATDLACDAEVTNVLTNVALQSLMASNDPNAVNKIRKNTTSFKITNILPSRPASNDPEDEEDEVGGSQGHESDSGIHIKHKNEKAKLSESLVYPQLIRRASQPFGLYDFLFCGSPVESSTSVLQLQPPNAPIASYLLTKAAAGFLTSICSSQDATHGPKDRFKVVKIATSEPVKVGRWINIDFADRQNPSKTTSVASNVGGGAGTVPHSLSEIDKDKHLQQPPQSVVHGHQQHVANLPQPNTPVQQQSGQQAIHISGKITVPGPPTPQGSSAVPTPVHQQQQNLHPPIITQNIIQPITCSAMAPPQGQALPQQSIIHRPKVIQAPTQAVTNENMYGPQGASQQPPSSLIAQQHRAGYSVGGISMPSAVPGSVDHSVANAVSKSYVTMVSAASNPVVSSQTMGLESKELESQNRSNHHQAPASLYHHLPTSMSSQPLHHAHQLHNQQQSQKPDQVFFVSAPPSSVLSHSQQQHTKPHQVTPAPTRTNLLERSSSGAGLDQEQLVERLEEISSAQVEDDDAEDPDSASGANQGAIDNRIEQAMDLVKSHLMTAVRSEVEELKEKIIKLEDTIASLQMENEFLKAHASAEVLAQLAHLHQQQFFQQQLAMNPQLLQHHQQQQQQQQVQQPPSQVQGPPLPALSVASSQSIQSGTGAPPK